MTERVREAEARNHSLEVGKAAIFMADTKYISQTYQCRSIVKWHHDTV